MREYKIYKTDLGWGIYKKLEKNWFIQMWFLHPQDKRWLNKDSAKTFYHREDAVSALIIMRRKDEWEDTN